MIEAKDLRVGNYLESHELLIPKFGLSSCGYIQITAYGISCIESGIITSLRPIRLNVNILGKFGFESNNHSNRMGKSIKNVFTIYFENNTISLEDEDWSVTHLYHIKYLHQLQNLYFALAGTELKMNPETKY